MKLYSDNKSAINIMHNPIQHDKKHMKTDKNFIKNEIENGTISLSYVLKKLVPSQKLCQNQDLILL